MNTSIFLVSLVTSLFVNCVQCVENNIVITESFWKTPEICEWGEIMTQISAQNNICNIVADKLYKNGLFPNMPSTRIKQFVPYKCNNKNSVMFCPPLTIQITGSEQIQMDGFFIGKGNDRVNSIFVYDIRKETEDTLNNISYMYDILNFNTMQIEEKEYTRRIEEQKKRKFTFVGRKEAILNFGKQIEKFGAEKIADKSGELNIESYEYIINLIRQYLPTLFYLNRY